MHDDEEFVTVKKLKYVCSWDKNLGDSLACKLIANHIDMYFY